ncbi:hypothetical protein HFP72_06795 [Nocardiopsis sp. ARC36]
MGAGIGGGDPSDGVDDAAVAGVGEPAADGGGVGPGGDVRAEVVGGERLSGGGGAGDEEVDRNDIVPGGLDSRGHPGVPKTLPLCGVELLHCSPSSCV